MGYMTSFDLFVSPDGGCALVSVCELCSLLLNDISELRNIHRSSWEGINTLRPRRNGRHYPDDIFKWIFLNENVWISIKISLKFVPKVSINNIPALVQIMAWRRSGDKPLSEPMMDSLLTHICVTRPQWVNTLRPSKKGTIWQPTFSNAFSCIKIYEFRLRFHRSLFLRDELNIFPRWFR